MNKALSEIQDIEAKREHGDLSGLKQSIAEIGLINPLTIDENGALLAGRRRFQVISELGWADVECQVIPVNGDQLKVSRITLDENLKRKNLSDPEIRAAIAAYDELKRKLEGNADRYSHPQPLFTVNNGWKQAYTARDLGISQRAVSQAVKAEKIVREQPEWAGKQTGQILRLKKKEQREEHKAYGMKLGAKAKDDLDNRLSLTKASVEEMFAAIKESSIDVIITDPPYSKQYLDCFSSLACFAFKALKPGGSLLAMTGQAYLPVVFKLLCGQMTYHWTLAYLTPGGQSPQIWPRKINTFWKPVVWLTKGKYEGDWHGDVLNSDVNDNDKRFHPWGQSESGISRLIEAFSKPDDVVCDPFVGGGTTAVVAIHLGRKFIGSDVDEDALEICRRRVVQSYVAC